MRNQKMSSVAAGAMLFGVAIGALALVAIAGSANAAIIGGFETAGSSSAWALGGNRVSSASFDSITVSAASQGTKFQFVADGDTTYFPAGNATFPNIAIGDVITFDYVLPAGGVLRLQNYSGFATLGTFTTTSSGTIGAGDWSHGSWTATIAISSGNGLVFQGQGSAFYGWALDNVQITPVPAPGAAAVLGLGGLMASRRRRA